jgi:GGDEF domain.
MVFSADMDNLKYINDNFGHAKGDIAIKIVADALLNASDDDELCIRMGGDEYTVIGIEYDSEKAEKFVAKFENAIRDFNKNNAYNFRISISYGWIIIPASENTRLEECLIIADEKMYKQKYAKEAMV